MISARRRVMLYWMLLLGPALAVGAGALWLLKREQARVMVQAQATEEARKEAVTARTRLIAENVEVLMSDVQATLAATLQETPEGREQVYLEGLRRTNPLVADTFEASQTGALIWGGVRAETTGWVSRRGWTPALPMPSAGRAEEGERERMEKKEMMEARQQVASNVDNYNRARSQTQQLASLKMASDEMASGAPAPAARFKDEAVVEADEDLALAVEGWGKRRDHAEAKAVTWTPWKEDASLQVYGWMEKADGGIRGMAIDLEGLHTQLNTVLPVERAEDENYALVRGEAQDGGKYSSAFKRREDSLGAVARVPLAATLLPGWAVEGRWTGSTTGGLSGGTFFTLSGLLVGCFVVAIIWGGGLLLREARRSELEARQKTSFVGNISHELKTPLTTIRMYAELLEQGRVSTEEKQRNYLGVISRESARLSRLIGNALDFSRLEQGKKTYALRELDIVSTLNVLLDAQEPRIVATGLKLERVWSEAELVVETDGDALQQIVLNLIDNACKYAAKGGEIMVEASRGKDQWLQIRVSDRGPGVPVAMRAKIFEKFQRLDDRLTAEQGGVGLGLGIARQLARGLGGELKCESRSGGGAVFVLNLP